jgi:hypothetical protein
MLLDGIFEATHVRLSTEKLAGLHIIGYIRKSMAKHIGNTNSSKVKTGFCGLLGNKGAVGTHFHQSGLSIDIGSKRLLFINNHLNADRKIN